MGRPLGRRPLSYLRPVPPQRKSYNVVLRLASHLGNKDHPVSVRCVGASLARTMRPTMMVAQATTDPTIASVMRSIIKGVQGRPRPRLLIPIANGVMKNRATA